MPPGEDDLRLQACVLSGAGGQHGSGAYSLRFRKVQCRCRECDDRRTLREAKRAADLTESERFALGIQREGYFVPHLWAQHVTGERCRDPRAVLRLRYMGRLLKVRNGGRCGGRCCDFGTGGRLLRVAGT